MKIKILICVDFEQLGINFINFNIVGSKIVDTGSGESKIYRIIYNIMNAFDTQKTFCDEFLYFKSGPPAENAQL
jgi:hypothetical protein